MIIYSGDEQVRHVYLDTAHSEHPTPSWYWRIDRPLRGLAACKDNKSVTNGKAKVAREEG